MLISKKINLYLCMNTEIISNDKKGFILAKIIGEISVLDIRTLAKKATDYDKETKFSKYILDLSNAIIVNLDAENFKDNELIKKNFAFCKDSKIALFFDGQDSVYKIIKMSANINDFDVELFKTQKDAENWLLKPLK
jgi:hypothetical protein